MGQVIEARARVVLNDRLRIVKPTLLNIYDELALHPKRTPPLLRRLAAAFSVASGLTVVRRDGLELFEHVLHRGIVAGGADMADYLEGEIVDHIFRNTAIFSAPANIFVALFTADPGEAGANTNEVDDSGTAYERATVSTSGGWSGSAGDATTDNAAEIAYAQATASWGTVSHVALTDSATEGAGNHYFNGALDSPKVVDTDDTFTFPIGTLDVALD